MHYLSLTNMKNVNAQAALENFRHIDYSLLHWYTWIQIFINLFILIHLSFFFLLETTRNFNGLEDK